jgi:hypothetical protein
LLCQLSYSPITGCYCTSLNCNRVGANRKFRTHQGPVLLGLAVHHMVTHQRIVLLEFQPACIIAAVFLGVVHMAAFSAAHLNQCAVAFFRHRFPLDMLSDYKAFDGIRTHDLTLTKGVLYQLSYEGINRMVKPPGWDVIVGRAGLEPAKATARKFTVSPLCRSGHRPI